MLKDKVLVTGSSGFVGRHVVEHLKVLNVPFSITTRKSFQIGDPSSHFIPAIDRGTDWGEALSGVGVVIHCAARVHVMNELTEEPLALYRETNAEGTLNLARQASRAGVKRFIFISSIKVNGESSAPGKPFRNTDPHSPKDCYGLSKSEAESRLLELSEETGLEVVIIRPGLIYGPGVKANFSALMNLVSKGFPLPFGCFTNKRSLVSIDNLVDLIFTCLDHPKAVNEVFLVSDDHDVSTSNIVRELAKALGKPTWQLYIPVWCYTAAGKVLNKKDVVDRLSCSLQVDISYTKETLGWTPPKTLREGFKSTAEDFLLAKRNSGKL